MEELWRREIVPDDQNQNPKAPRSATEETELETLRKFHQANFEKKEKDHLTRNIFRRILDGGEKLEAKDFAHAEALKEHADFERRRTAEFQEWERRLAVVVDRLKKKRDDPEGEGKKIKPLLLVLGGGMRGSYGSGQVVALRKLGLTDHFDTVVGISAGACDAAYFLAGDQQVLLGASIYYEECTTSEFINFKHINRVLNVEVVSDVMRRGPKALDVAAIKNSRPNFYVQVTKTGTNESVLINAKTATEGTIEAIRASMAFPLLYGKTVHIDGGEYVDGAFEPLPIEKVIQQFKPTDILILPNRSFTNTDVHELSKGEYLLSKIMPKRGLLGLLGKMLKSKEKLRRAFQDIKSATDINIAVLWPPDSGLTSLSNTESDEIKTAIIEAANDTFARFKEEHEVELL